MTSKIEGVSFETAVFDDVVEPSEATVKSKVTRVSSLLHVGDVLPKDPPRGKLYLIPEGPQAGVYRYRQMEDFGHSDKIRLIGAFGWGTGCLRKAGDRVEADSEPELYWVLDSDVVIGESALHFVSFEKRRTAVTGVLDELERRERLEAEVKKASGAAICPTKLFEEMAKYTGRFEDQFSPSTIAKAASAFTASCNVGETPRLSSFTASGLFPPAGMGKSEHKLGCYTCTRTLNFPTAASKAAALADKGASLPGGWTFTETRGGTLLARCKGCSESGPMTEVPFADVKIPAYDTKIIDAEFHDPFKSGSPAGLKAADVLKAAAALNEITSPLKGES